MSKHRSGSAPRVRYGKTDLRYWQAAVFQPTYTRNGLAHQLSEWAVKIQHLGRRETFPLGTANRTEAAAKAKRIYFALKSSGWETALADFKPKSQIPTVIATTVGEFLEQVIATASGRPKTVQGYCRALRKIVADIFNIDEGLSKFDYRAGGGREKWLARVHAVKLQELTSDKIQNWKIAFLARAKNDPVKRRAARSSFNSFTRQAKSLFSPKVLQFVGINISGTPFDGIEPEPKQSMRYRGSVDIESLARAAQRELPPEQLKIFLLALIV